MHYLKLRLLPTNKNGTFRVFKSRDEKFSYTDLDGERGVGGGVKKVDR